MVMYSSEISQQIQASQMYMLQSQQQAQMLSMQMGTMPRMGAASTQPGYAGVYGEQVANRLASGGRTMASLGGLGLGIAGSMTGLPLDPFSSALSMGRMGLAGGGIAGGIAGAALGATPWLVAGKVASVYGGAFMGGMREQSATNSMLRNNFNFQGGQGAYGRGFSQGQMGQIGSQVSQEMRSFPYTSSGEMNQMIMQGNDAGMFTAVKDVQQFSSRFKTMIDGLRKIQKELGGTLSDAMAFTRGAQQLGMFSSGQRTAFASELRDTMATTGMDQQQAFSLAATGSMLSRATGGLGRQGAVGALRTARTLGAAMSSGAINMEALSEATGGLQGNEAVQAFTTRALQLSDRFSRTAQGRYSLFALSNKSGTGLDQDMLDRFRSGDVSVSGIMGDAHRNVNRMGRAKAINSEGRLRGAMMEEGGLSGQLGILRLRVGDRALEGSDDLAQLVMQRKMGVSQQEAQVLTSLMRNQGSIASQERVESSMAKGQVGRQRETESRSLDSFMANLEHGMADAAGVTRARELGKKFLTRVSSAAEKTMNEFLGIQASALTNADRMSITRVTMGMGTTADRARVAAFSGGGGGGGTAGGDPFALSFSSQALRGLGMHDPTQSLGEVMKARGVNVGGMSIMQREVALNEARLARGGTVLDSYRGDYDKLMKDPAGTRRKMMMASLAGPEGAYGALGKGISANAADAAANAMGMDALGLGPDEAGGIINNDTGLGRILSRTAKGTGRGWSAGTGMNLTGAITGGLSALGGALYEEAQGTSREKAMGYIASGGHVGAFGRFATDNAGRSMWALGKSGAGKLTEERLRGGAKARGVSLEDARLVGEATRGGGISKESFETVLSSDSFQTGLRGIAGLKGEAQQKAIEALEETMSKEFKGDQGKAAAATLAQVRSNTSRFKGKLGSEFEALLTDDKKRAEAMKVYGEIGGKFQGALTQLKEGMKGDNFSNAAISKPLQKLVAELGGAASGKGGAVAASTDDLVKMLSTMDPSSAEYGRISDALNFEEGRGVLMSGRQRANAITQMSGGGRRGSPAQAESLLGRLTGNSLGSMEFTLNGKAVQGRNKASALIGAFEQGGDVAEQARRQLVAQLKDQKVENAERNVNMIMESVSNDKKNKKGGRVTEDEAGGIYDVLSKDKDLQRIQTEGIKKAQEQSDPLGKERNEILNKILDKLPSSSEGSNFTPAQPPAKDKKSWWD